MQGVSIIIATKLKDGNKEKCNVRVADLYGKRKNKFDVLNSDTPEFVDIELDKKMYYFVDKNIEGKEEYDEGFSITSIFKKYSSGVKTSNDSELVAFAQYDSSNYRYDYKLFDSRFICYDGRVGRPRATFMQNMHERNKSFSFMRKLVDAKEYSTIMVHENMIDINLYGFQTYQAPLYLYDDQGNRSSNLDQKIVKDIKAKAPKASDETIFDYIYGVLHSPTYRDKYKEFLKIDFPRVPFPQDQKEFDRYAMLGAQLRELHLMTSSESEKIITTYPIAGNNIVEKPKFVTTDQSETGKVYINETQYFGGVPKIAWEFYIGGYQPAQKWLKDRKGRELSAQDLEHYQRIITVLTQTDTLMKQIG